MLCKKSQSTGFYMIEIFIIKELSPEGEKILEYHIKMQTKAYSYLGSKFNTNSYKWITLIVLISYIIKRQSEISDAIAEILCGRTGCKKLYLKSNQILTKDSNSFPSWYANGMIFLFLLIKINSNSQIFSTSLSLFSTFSSLSCISLILCRSLLMIDSFSCFCICPFRFFASMFVSGMLSRFWN